METQVITLSKQGLDDQAITQQLTAQGHRSPLRQTLLPSTVKTIRLKHHIFQNRSQSHPRRIPGYLTIPQVAKALELPPHWIYDRIHKGTIAITRQSQLVKLGRAGMPIPLLINGLWIQKPRRLRLYEFGSTPNF
ncbi:MAG: hypothetical protein QNJ47_05375 [Nostocaceae cyanobacterium]|nr:hypothetical protein [Nostocaceae cyanobacterium]